MTGLGLSPTALGKQRQTEQESTIDTNDSASDGDSADECCAICLSSIENRTVIVQCLHDDFCFACLSTWCQQSHKCPLCVAPIEHLIHSIRSDHDYQKHYLLPLLPATEQDTSLTRSTDLRAQSRRQARSTGRCVHWGRRRPATDEPDPEIALERRRYIYRHSLYAKHVACNRFTRHKPFSPTVYAATPLLQRKVAAFTRRELAVFANLDIGWLVHYIDLLLKKLDARQEAAIKLIGEFIGKRAAEHFVHELLAFAQSPYTTLPAWDRVVQYDRPRTPSR